MHKYQTKNQCSHDQYLRQRHTSKILGSFTIIYYKVKREKTKYQKPPLRSDYKNYDKKLLAENIKTFDIDQHFNDNDTIEKLEKIYLISMEYSTYNWRKVSINSKKWWNYPVAKLNTKKNKIGNALNE